jgi:hypothetical protein
VIADPLDLLDGRAGSWTGTTIEARKRESFSSHSAISQSLTARAIATAASGLFRLSTAYRQLRTACWAPDGFSNCS